MIVPEAFSHPAKFSYSLTERMFGHAIRNGWITKGSVVVDPFGGVGCGGIVAAYCDVQWIGVELEAKFVDLAKQNFELHRRKWEKLGSPQPIICCGDSWGLGIIVEALADIVISSPPYAEITQTGGKKGLAKYGTGLTQGQPSFSEYGQTPGQLGAMKPGQVDAILSSPPYAESLKGDGTQSETAAESRAKRLTEGGSLGQSQRTQGYGSKENLGNLKPGEVDSIISSPPYEGIDVNDKSRVQTEYKGKGSQNEEQNYGHTIGQLGADKGPTFWEAAREIVQQCHQILKPGGHAIWVTKAFVCKGKIVDFPGDWQRLCESVGFKMVCMHRAMLVKETKYDGLFGTITEKKERKGFFRQLAEKKGSPPIDYETILCMEKRK